MMPSGHKAFLVNNTKDVELLMMHNRTFAAEYVWVPPPTSSPHCGKPILHERIPLASSDGNINKTFAGSPTTSRRESALTSLPVLSNSESRLRTRRRRSLLRSKKLDWTTGDMQLRRLWGVRFLDFGNHCMHGNGFALWSADGHELACISLENEIHLR
jgi:hypothetical protein